MDCEQCQQELVAYALGDLDPSAEQAVREHLAAGCGSCAEASRDTLETFAALAGTLSPVEPPARLRAQLMRRAEPARRNAAAPAPQARPHRAWWADWAKVAIAASIAAAGASAVTYALVTRWAGEQLALVRRDVDDLARRVADVRADERKTSQTVNLIRSPRLLVAQLESKDQPAASVKLLWDRAGGKLQLTAVGMKPTAGGKVYELWAVTTDKQTIPAGTFAVGADGIGEMASDPPNVKNVAAMAITEEPPGGSRTPTLPILLIGKPAPQTPAGNAQS